jgi:hypothetical protein
MNPVAWRVIFAVAILGAFLLELPAQPVPVHVWDYPLFYAVMGALGCIILSFVAKGVMAASIDRPEDFYGPEDGEYDWSTQSPAAAEQRAADGGPHRTGG